ncbi:uncharacterized protein LOC118433276 [Folsomia candida]|nr:uncharacterized protein LOC118433276 [Folsomia candida]
MVTVLLKLVAACTSIKEAKELLKIYSDEFDRFLKPPPEPATSSSAPLSANKPFSWWDIIHVVGSVDDAVRCGQDRDVAGATLNTVLGVGGLAMDVLSLGTISAFGNVIAKTTVVEGTKQGTKVVVAKGAQ